MSAPQQTTHPTAGPDERGGRVLAALGRGMWRARLVMTVASVACLVLAAGALWLSLVDLTYFLGSLVRYGGLAAEARSDRSGPSGGTSTPAWWGAGYDCIAANR